MEEQGFQYTIERYGDDQRAVIHSYTGHDTEVVIPSALGNYPVDLNYSEPIFQDNPSIESITISEGITSLGNILKDTSIKTVTLPSSIDYLQVDDFSSCSQLEAIEISWSNPRYISVEGVLYSSDLATLICYPRGKPDSTFEPDPNCMKLSKNCFYNVTKLKTLNISVTVKSIEDSAIYAGSIETINIAANVQELSGASFAFNDPTNESPTSLKQINVDASNPYFSSQDGVLYNKDQTELVFYPPNKEDNSFDVPSTVNSVGDRSFQQCTNLERITFTSTIDLGSQNAYNENFGGAIKLIVFKKGIDDPETTARVTNIMANHIFFAGDESVQRFVEEGEKTGWTHIGTYLNLDLTGVKLSLEDQKYTGDAITPTVTLPPEYEPIEKDVDYTVTYENNVEPGTATVTVCGIGAFTGSTTGEFEISDEDLNGGDNPDPDDPKDPSNPDPDNPDPDDPDDLNKPDVPDTPNPPVNPSTPIVPDNPSNPDVPDTPDNPDDPDSPDNPDDPTTPDNPDNPDNPDTPDEPVVPDQPIDPVEPVIPDTPSTPDTPDEPVVPSNPNTPSLSGSWVQNTTGWRYEFTDGTYLTNSWQNINGLWYYFNGAGYMYTGWLKLNNEWYYFKNTGAMAVGWLEIDDNWYYFNTKDDDVEGVMAVGWKHIKDAWYYFNDRGVMQTGWLKQGNNWFYLKDSGVMATGWQKIAGVWYYFNRLGEPTEGVMATKWKLIDGTWYHFTDSGAMQTGWLKQGNSWYYLNSNGGMATGWKQVGGVWYYFANSGAMATSWLQINDNWYFFSSSGTMQTGWQKIGGSWYYLNSSGVMQTGWLKQNNTWYYLNQDGVMATGWKLIDNTWYYLNSSGVMQTGWLSQGNAWYYLKASGAMATGWQLVNGIWYYCNTASEGVEGTMAVGWKQVDDTWYYLNPSGAMATGWLNQGPWYYLKASGAMATGWEKVDGIWYYMNPTGAMSTGWYKLGPEWYYSNASGAMQANRWIGNYWVSGSGAMATNTTVDNGRYQVDETGLWVK